MKEGIEKKKKRRLKGNTIHLLAHEHMFTGIDAKTLMRAQYARWVLLYRQRR